MWIETQYGDLLNADRYSKIEWLNTDDNADDYEINAYVGTEAAGEVIIDSLTLGEKAAMMGRLTAALIDGRVYFDTAAELVEIRSEVARFEADGQDAKGKTLETQH